MKIVNYYEIKNSINMKSFTKKFHRVFSSNITYFVTIIYDYMSMYIYIYISSNFLKFNHFEPLRRYNFKFYSHDSNSLDKLSRVSSYVTHSEFFSFPSHKHRYIFPFSHPVTCNNTWHIFTVPNLSFVKLKKKERKKRETRRGGGKKKGGARRDGSHPEA